MEAIIESIRAAVASDASPETRAAGADACRAILAALQAKPGEVLAPHPIPNAPPLNVSPIANVVAALRGMPADQLFDLVIAKLRTMVPSGADVARVAPIKFQLVPRPGVKP